MEVLRRHFSFLVGNPAAPSQVLGGDANSEAQPARTMETETVAAKDEVPLYKDKYAAFVREKPGEAQLHRVLETDQGSASSLLAGDPGASSQVLGEDSGGKA